MKTMKTTKLKIIESLNTLLNNFTFSREKMPALIPVRVITKVNPDHHR